MVSRAQFQAEVQVILPADPRLVLVTDLDGTLLAGDPQERQFLYRWLADRRDQVLHIYATGRELRSIAALFQNPDHPELRQPHLVISDVGCTVACGESLQVVPMLVDPIEALWGPCAARVRALTAGQPGLSPQPVWSQRRHAFYADPDLLDPLLLERLAQEGVDCLFSDGRYLDVLPAGVNKGSTLQRLLRVLELGEVPVLVAGDSLNDLAMFQAGYPGVMVGNAEKALRAQLPQLSDTYLASAHGCGGILEGLAHFGFGQLLSPQI